MVRLGASSHDPARTGGIYPGTIRQIRVEVLRKKKEKSENKGRVPTEMELELELTQQGSSYEVLAYENSLIYKERTKKLHDDKIKNRIFNVGDQVLLFNSRLKIFRDYPRWLQLSCVGYCPGFQDLRTLLVLQPRSS
nr:reverse transcriptase domain-containing protein [Tanacetum cinerariifolium]